MIVVDVETTGLHPSCCSILSIGAVEFENPKNQFYIECGAFEHADISDAALDINGFKLGTITNPEMLSEANAVEFFWNWSTMIADKTLAGENITFDRDFLNCALERAGKSQRFGRRTQDLHSVSLFHHDILGLEPPRDSKGFSSLSLDETLKFCGIPPEPKPHNALTGAKLEAEALKRLLRGVGMFVEYSSYDVPMYLKKYRVRWGGIIWQGV